MYRYFLSPRRSVKAANRLLCTDCRERGPGAGLACLCPAWGAVPRGARRAQHTAARRACGGKSGASTPRSGDAPAGRGTGDGGGGRSRVAPCRRAAVRTALLRPPPRVRREVPAGRTPRGPRAAAGWPGAGRRRRARGVGWPCPGRVRRGERAWTSFSDRSSRTPYTGEPACRQPRLAAPGDCVPLRAPSWFRKDRWPSVGSSHARTPRTRARAHRHGRGRRGTGDGRPGERHGEDAHGGGWVCRAAPLCALTYSLAARPRPPPGLRRRGACHLGFLGDPCRAAAARSPGALSPVGASRPPPRHPPPRDLRVGAVLRAPLRPSPPRCPARATPPPPPPPRPTAVAARPTATTARAPSRPSSRALLRRPGRALPLRRCAVSWRSPRG